MALPFQYAFQVRTKSCRENRFLGIASRTAVLIKLFAARLNADHRYISCGVDVREVFSMGMCSALREPGAELKQGSLAPRSCRGLEEGVCNA